MKFTKMQGLGNDYVYINCFEENVENPNELAKKISDRHFGVGSDGLILILPSNIADCKMRMFNWDGSESEMCGNGIRCVGKFVHDKGIVNKNEITVETLAGIKTINITLDENNKASMLTVNMGEPIFNPKEIPVISNEEI
ncbi:MAG: diaminopimelate epimerase, partial [Eubacteriales bacterium]|nr:diaminopimelate epimerase [Eubacteriales bacterium]